MYKDILSGKFKPHRCINDQVQNLLEGIFRTKQDERFSLEEIRKHKWFGEYEKEDTEGFKVGKDLVTPDQSLLKKVEDLGFDLEYTKNSVELFLHNDETMTYHLLMKNLKGLEMRNKTGKVPKPKPHKREEEKRPERVDTKASLLTAPLHQTIRSSSDLSESIQGDRSGYRQFDPAKLWTASQKNSFLNRGGKSKMMSTFRSSQKN